MRDRFFYRSFELDRGTLNKGERSVEVAFSSEIPVQRWFGSEILLHGKDNVNLSRLKSMGTVLFNHDPRTIVGVPKDIRIDGKRGRAKIVFDDDEDGQKAMRKVESGSLRGVSVGYIIEKFREVRRDEEWEGIKGPAYVATRWAPYEISLTPVPADHTVGVGRDATRSLDGITIERSNKEHDEMTLEELMVRIEREREDSAKRMKELEDKISTLPAELQRQQQEAARPRIMLDGEEYRDLLSRASAISPDAVGKFSGWVAEGKGAVEIQRGLLDLATTKPDARDMGGSGDSSEGNPPSKTLKDLDDDALIRSLTSPATTLE